MRLPETPQDLTPEWFTWALGRGRPGVAVTCAEVTDVMTATGTKVRVRLGYNASGDMAGLPPSLIVKGPFGRNIDDMEHTFTHELWAYRDLISGIGLNTPACYFAEKEGKNPVLILEDLALSNATFGKAQQPLGFDQARSILSFLARLHARYWDAPEVHDDNGPLGWVLRTVTGWHLDYMHMVLQPENWALYLALPRGAAAPMATKSDPGRLLRALEAQWSRHQCGALTLGHGDAHICNTFFNLNGAGLLDWEMRRCPWYHDVSYFMGSALDVVDRRLWESALIQHYLTELAGHGGPVLGFDAAFHEYRREMLYGYVLFLTNGDGTQFWSEADNTAVATRFAMAVEDLGSLAAIETES